MFDLKNKYIRTDFLVFLGDFLPEDNMTYDKQQDLPLERTKSITNAVVLSESKSLGIKVFEIEHSGSREARVNLAREVFRIMADTLTNKALVVFKSSVSEQWRLSLMTIKLDYDESKNKIKKAYSNPRRYSYMLGKESKTVTPYKYLIDSGRVKTVDDLEKRFSIEVVNNEFYKEIAKLYDELVGTEEITRKLIYPSRGDESNEFAVRLIGRIIFCWFLREKKSKSGIPLIPSNILSRNASDQTNYYHEVLATLFFEVLNKPVEKRTQKFQSGEFTSIPYLNGGLFSNDKLDHYNFDKELESSILGLVNVPDAWLHDLFDLLEQFNFTVDENTSYDTELSIDPEMLGRVFENLLARINPDTGETVRKSTGSFYTPREIVDYMVDESLVSYLASKTSVNQAKIDALISYDPFDDLDNKLSKQERESILEALSTLTVLDPACGSGAFPIGILQKIVFVISKIDQSAEWWLAKQLEGASLELRKDFTNRSVDYIRKLGIIRQTIFGVDIQPIATEISRLRCFLTLIVDEEVDDKQENRGIRPLPNLDFKFVTANSLIGLPKPEDNKGKISEDQAAIFEETSHIDELKQIRNEYFNSTNHERHELQSRFDRLQKQMVLTNVDVFRGSASKLYDTLSRWDPFGHEACNWFDPEWMFGVSNGFDIVIGNPPYFVYQGYNKNEIPQIKSINLYEKAQGGKLNAYKLFLALAPSLLTTGGITSFIFQNSFLADNSAKKIRQFYLENQQIVKIDSFPERDNVHKRVFESVKMSVCVMLAKNIASDDESFELNVWEDKKRGAGYSTNFTSKELLTYDPIATPIPYLKEEEKQLFSKCFTGAVRGAISCFEGELNMTFHRSYFNNDPTNPKTIKGAQVQRYRLVDDMSQGQLEYVDESKYLSDFGKSNKSRHHEHSRIVMQGITGVDDKQRLVMSLVSEGNYCANSCNYILVNDQRYSEYLILALFNSRLFNWIFKKTSTNSNVNCYEIENLPIFEITDKEDLTKRIVSFSKEICELYDKKTSKTISTEVVVLEKKINDLVYGLYGLTPNEINLIEAK